MALLLVQVVAQSDGIAVAVPFPQPGHASQDAVSVL
jgi:hypothetical protein